MIKFIKLPIIAEVITEVKNAISIGRLNKEKMLELSKSEKALYFGLGIIFIPPIINLILIAIDFGSSFSGIFSRFLFWPVIIPALALIGSIFIMGVIADKWFNHKIEVLGMFRVLSYAMLPAWISILVFLIATLSPLDPSFLFNLIWILSVLWMYVVAYYVLTHCFKLHTQDALIVVVAGAIFYVIFQLLLGRIIVGKFYRFFY